MRKDAKIGFAVAGVALAVLVVYTLVVPKVLNKNKTVATGHEPGVTLTSVDGEKATGSDAPVEATPITVAGAKESPKDPFDNTRTEPLVTNPAIPAGVGTPTGGSPKPVTAIATGNDAPATPADGVDWGKLLAGSNKIPPMMSETPIAGETTPQPAPNTPVSTEQTTAAPVHPTFDPVTNTNGAFGGGVNDPREPALAQASHSVAQTSALTALLPSTRPAATLTGRTHTVVDGETLMTIAAAEYGNGRFYPHIMRANPIINPNRLKLGSKLLVPDITEVRPETKTTASANQTSIVKVTHITPVDASKSYKVQSGDSLYKIAVKLYGKGAMADKLYELNKDTIGADRGKLKLNMVLKLPEAPTVTAAAR